MLHHSSLLVLLALRAQGFSVPASTRRTALVPGTPRASFLTLHSSPEGATSALDEACDPTGPPDPECADAITGYLDALSKGEELDADAAEAISNYVDGISDGEIEFSSREAVEGYLDKVASGEVEPPSGSRVETYMDALSEGMIARPNSEVKMVSCLSNPQAVGKKVDRSNFTRGKVPAGAFREAFKAGSSDPETEEAPPAAAANVAANREYNDVMRNVKEDRPLAAPRPIKTVERAMNDVMRTVAEDKVPAKPRPTEGVFANRSYNDVVRTVKEDRPLAPRKAPLLPKKAAAPKLTAAAPPQEETTTNPDETTAEAPEEKEAATPAPPSAAADRSHNDVMRTVRQDRNVAGPRTKRTAVTNYNDVVRSVRPTARASEGSDPNRAGIQPSSNQSDVGRMVRETKRI